MNARLSVTALKRGGLWWGPVLMMALVVIAVPATPALAQVEIEALTTGDTLYEIRLTDGSVLFARVTEVEGETIVLVTSGGARLEVARSQIREVRVAEGRVVEGEFWRKDPNTSRLFFTATGRTLDKGKAYVGTTLIVLPWVAVGVSDRVTLAAGAPLFFSEAQWFYVAPKVQLVRTPTAQISVGTLFIVVDDERVGINYGVGIFGTPDNSLTVGLGFGFEGDDFSSQPVAMIGGEARASRRIKLITENYSLPGETGVLFSITENYSLPGETGVLFSGGFRIIGERFSTDLAPSCCRRRRGFLLLRPARKLLVRLRRRQLSEAIDWWDGKERSRPTPWGP